MWRTASPSCAPAGSSSSTSSRASARRPSAAGRSSSPILPRSTTSGGFPGVHETELDSRRLRIAFEGQVDAIVKALARHEVLDIRVHEGDLEEVFLRYYRGDER